jgi:hypothetical protein
MMQLFEEQMEQRVQVRYDTAVAAGETDKVKQIKKLSLFNSISLILMNWINR